MLSMARNRVNLQQAMELLIQNQAALVAQHTSFLSLMAEFRRDFARMEKDLDQIKATLVRHEHILETLTEAIRQKIGFKSK